MFLWIPVLILLVMPGGTFWLISCQMLNMVIVRDVHSLKKPKQRFWNSATYGINHFTVVASPSLLLMFQLAELRKRRIFSNHIPETLVNYCIITQLCHPNLIITVGLNLRGVREFQFIFHNLHEISFIWYQKTFAT